MTEHVFISELLQETWFRFNKIVEVLRSEVDASGYDIALECNGYIRHVQLKTSFSDAARNNVNVNIALGEKPSGCVVWILRDEDYEECRVKFTYLFFGGKPGEPLLPLDNFKTGKHSKGDANGIKGERKSIRVVPKSKFVRCSNITELIKLLFDI
ncbi:hypothetical protein [Desulfitobacterium sp. AusDCA]|uniref:hypothetical protein n=1 Tax=Desulfitobacterium sp. AusDCA TaxID=3240383 RepID=UPI003DA6F556